MTIKSWKDFYERENARLYALMQRSREWLLDEAITILASRGICIGGKVLIGGFDKGTFLSLEVMPDLRLSAQFRRENDLKVTLLSLDAMPYLRLSAQFRMENDSIFIDKDADPDSWEVVK